MFIFIRIPKTGSSSMHTVFQKYNYEEIKGSCTAFYDEDPELLKENIRKNFSPEKNLCFGHVNINWVNDFNLIPISYYESCFKFTFVRNPWDRMVSLYKHRTDLLHEDLPDFNIWIRDYINKDLPPVGGYNVKGLSFGNCQLDWIPKDIDFIGKFETIQKDFDFVCEKTGIEKQELPIINKTNHKPYYEYYNDESIEIIYNKHRRDVDEFNYSFLN